MSRERVYIKIARTKRGRVVGSMALKGLIGERPRCPDCGRDFLASTSFLGYEGCSSCKNMMIVEGVA